MFQMADTSFLGKETACKYMDMIIYKSKNRQTNSSEEDDTTMES